METTKAAIDPNELKKALQGETVRTDLETLAKECEAEATELSIQAALGNMREGTLQDIKDLKVGDLAEGDSESQQEAARMTDEDVTQDLGQAQAGKPAGRESALAQALFIRAKDLRARSEQLKRESKEGPRPDRPSPREGPSGGVVVEGNREEVGRKISDALGPSGGGKGAPKGADAALAA